LAIATLLRRGALAALSPCLVRTLCMEKENTFYGVHSEFVDNICNSVTAAPRRLGGAEPLSGTCNMYGEGEHVIWCALGSM